MQTLGLSPDTVRSESRLKSLFWPSLKFETDVDLLARQSVAVCSIVAAVTLIFGFVTGHPIATAFDSVFFFLGGMGSRQRSRFAATMILIVYAVGFLSGFSIVRLIFTGLLLGNARGAWLSAKWSTTSVTAQPLPTRFHETITDRFLDRLPPFLWPKIKWLFYILLSPVEMLGVISLALQLFR